MAPHARHPALLEWRAAPGLVARLTRVRNQLIAPQLFAIAHIMPRDVAAEPGHLTGAAGDDHAVGDDRATRILDQKIAASIALPDARARAGVQRDNDVVPG